MRSILRSGAGAMVAGAAGTAALSLWYVAERRLRRHQGPLDFDDGPVPGRIVARMLRLSSVSERELARLGMLFRWTYGPAFGITHRVLRRTVPEPAASLVFGAILMSATLSLFPLLGRTPPPWRWPGDVLATSVASHAAYVIGVAVVDDALLSRRSPVPRT